MAMTKSTLNKAAQMRRAGKSFDTIGAELGISASWVRTQLVQAGLHKPGPARGGQKRQRPLVARGRRGPGHTTSPGRKTSQTTARHRTTARSR